jgi:sulfopyruvate decarboxylase subunit alpha
VFTGQQIADLFKSSGVTHVVTVPDSTIGQWEHDIERAGINLVRVCREGEAWTIAGGLYMGGAMPLVMIQCTGLFESGDALRNMVHDWRMPIYSMVGYRSYLNQDNLPGDTCLVFTEPILAAWKLDVCFVKKPDQLEEIGRHIVACREGSRAGVTLLAEGRS